MPGNLPEIDSKTDFFVGEAIVIGNRTLRLFVKTLTLRSMLGAVLGALVSPYALLMIEPGGEYAYSLSEEDTGRLMDPDELKVLKAYLG